MTETLGKPTLFIVATPIGTLDDWSSRAKAVIQSIDWVLCEDTRRTGQLLNHFGIKKPLESVHEHNEKEKTPSIIEKISLGSNAALMTDGGTPGVSDPGSYLISQCHKKGIQILSIPGPSALASSMAASGFRAPRWLFCGFLNRTTSKQNQEFTRWEALRPCVITLFESPYRVCKTLENIQAFWPEHPFPICVSKELSKRFETHFQGPLPQILDTLRQNSSLKGEFTITIDLN